MRKVAVAAGSAVRATRPPGRRRPAGSATRPGVGRGVHPGRGVARDGVRVRAGAGRCPDVDPTTGRPCKAPLPTGGPAKALAVVAWMGGGDLVGGPGRRRRWPPRTCWPQDGRGGRRRGRARTAGPN